MRSTAVSRSRAHDSASSATTHRTRWNVYWRRQASGGYGASRRARPRGRRSRGSSTRRTTVARFSSFSRVRLSRKTRRWLPSWSQAVEAGRMDAGNARRSTLRSLRAELAGARRFGAGAAVRAAVRRPRSACGLHKRLPLCRRLLRSVEWPTAIHGPSPSGRQAAARAAGERDRSRQRHRAPAAASAQPDGDVDDHCARRPRSVGRSAPARRPCGPQAQGAEGLAPRGRRAEPSLAAARRCSKPRAIVSRLYAPTDRRRKTELLRLPGRDLRQESLDALTSWSRETDREALVHGLHALATRASQSVPTRNTIARQFGSWQAALEAAGLGDRLARAPRPIGGEARRAVRRAAQRERVIAAVRAFERERGHRPRALEFFRWRYEQAVDAPTQATVYKLFPGGWPEVLRVLSRSPV